VTYKDARPCFDAYTLRYSTPRELAEVLAYTHIGGEQCLGRVLRLRAVLLCALLLTACTFHVVVKPPPLPVHQLKILPY
jgi:hypothetical protein